MPECPSCGQNWLEFTCFYVQHSKFSTRHKSIVGFIHSTAHRGTFNGFSGWFQDSPGILTSTWCVNLYVPFYCLLPGWTSIFCCILSHETSHSCLTPKAFSIEHSHFPHFDCVLQHRVYLAKQLMLFKFQCPWPPFTAGGKVASSPQSQKKTSSSWCRRAFLLDRAYRAVCSEMGRMPA